MKKKWKIIISSLVLVIALCSGYLLYIFKFKEYDVADEEVSKIVDDPYEVELPDGSRLIMGEDGKSEIKPADSSSALSEGGSVDSVTDGTTGSTSNDLQSAAVQGSQTDQEDQSDQQTSTTQSDSHSNSSSGNPSSAAGNPTVKPDGKATVASIKGRYEPTLNNLQGQVDGKLNSLIGRAKSEYSAKKANGEGIDFGYFYNKYMSAANGLEAQTDAVFEGVVGALERDLQANGYDKSYSQSVRDEYAAKKKASRESLLNKAMGR
ncbi:MULTISPECIES: hypothetical protein [unclassified Sporosarcina]|uniref:hypothetical protein n=1 Tax=unclassified Sporosarcina TaxID=2647733 RepID=UPI00203B4751|nr:MULTISPECIES: hypothetical protein [unclassified Sporosarcina]GKV66237.1 hypothetical protein NCCP2331_23900 [Sporosarcina sp. NCCP-2331]GLB56273.1 hypothetical protein NCCP2378_20600 [Sporosarcina sp. NCCP-2378]